MARDVYSIRIFATGDLEPAAGVVGPIVPAGLVYIVRDIDVFEFSSVANAELLVYSPVLGPIYTPTRSASGVPSDWQWRGRQVYNEGEQVGFLSLLGKWAVMASGYQLTLP